jgi:hypothetical protein
LSPVHEQFGPGHERCMLGYQEGDDVGDFDRFAEAPE